MARVVSRTKGAQARARAGRRPPRPACTGELRSAPAGAQPSPVGRVLPEGEAHAQAAHWYSERLNKSGDSTFSSGSESISPLNNVFAPKSAPAAAIKPTKSAAAAKPLAMQVQASTNLNEEEHDLNSAIKVCAHNGDIATAEGLLRRIEEEGEDCELSIDTYNAVIHTCTQAGDIERVESYMQRMKERGFEPNLVTFNSVINACATLGDAPRAEKWLLTLVNRGIQPNHVTYGTICKVFARQGGVEQIEGIMRLLENNGIPLNEYFFASLISACGAANPPDPLRAERALADLVRRGLRPQSVKRAIARVVGNRRTAYLFEGLGRMAGGGASGEPTSTRTGSNAGCVAPVPAGNNAHAGLSGGAVAGGKGANQNSRRRPKAGGPAQKARSPAGPPTGGIGFASYADEKTRKGPVAPGPAPRPLLSPGAVPPAGRDSSGRAPAAAPEAAPRPPVLPRPPQAWRSDAAAYVPGAMLLHAAASPHAAVASEPDSRLMHYGL